MDQTENISRNKYSICKIFHKKCMQDQHQINSDKPYSRQSTCMLHKIKLEKKMEAAEAGKDKFSETVIP
jgi:hypothetical protein